MAQLRLGAAVRGAGPRAARPRAGAGAGQGGAGARGARARRRGGGAGRGEAGAGGGPDDSAACLHRGRAAPPPGRASTGAIAPLERAAQQAGARRLSLRDLHFTLGDSLAHVGRVRRGRGCVEERRSRPSPRTATRARRWRCSTRRRDGRPTPPGAVADLVQATPTPESYVLAVRTLQIAGQRAEAAGVLAQARRRFPESRVLRQLGTAPASGRRQ